MRRKENADAILQDTCEVGENLMRLMVRLFLILLSSGCATPTPYEQLMKTYHEAPICCESMKDFAFESIGIGDSVSFDLDENSPAFLFQTGKSYFKAYAIPQSSYPYQVSIKSYMLGEQSESAYIFYPRIITLDEEFRVERSTDLQCFQILRVGFLEWLKQPGALWYKIEGSIAFTEENSSEKYLVIITTDELLHAKTPLSRVQLLRIPTPIPDMPGAAILVPIGKEEVLVPHMPSGRITISVFPQGKAGNR